MFFPTPKIENQWEKIQKIRKATDLMLFPDRQRFVSFLGEFIKRTSSNTDAYGLGLGRYSNTITLPKEILWNRHFMRIPNLASKVP